MLNEELSYKPIKYEEFRIKKLVSNKLKEN
jgi:hypothetical protein